MMEGLIQEQCGTCGLQLYQALLGCIDESLSDKRINAKPVVTYYSDKTNGSILQIENVARPIIESALERLRRDKGLFHAWKLEILQPTSEEEPFTRIKFVSSKIDRYDDFI